MENASSSAGGELTSVQGMLEKKTATIRELEAQITAAVAEKAAAEAKAAALQNELLNYKSATEQKAQMEEALNQVKGLFCRQSSSLQTMTHLTDKQNSHLLPCIVARWQIPEQQKLQ